MKDKCNKMCVQVTVNRRAVHYIKAGGSYWEDGEGVKIIILGGTMWLGNVVDRHHNEYWQKKDYFNKN